MNRMIAAFVALALLAGGIAALFLNRTPVDSGAAVEPSPIAVEPATGDQVAVGEISDEVDAANDPSPVMSPAKRIRGGTAAAQDLTKAEFELPPSGNETADKLIRRVEKALAGDVDHLIGMSRMIRDCSRGMNSEEQLQQRLDRMAQFQSRNPGGPAMPGRGGGGSVEYESLEDMEADMWARFDECQVAKDVLDESLYEQVCRLAESGWPSARYLYAIWPPSQDSFLAIDTLEMLEYQSLALEYTWMNMQEREPLGLLAMAQSYSANRPSMFTPSNGIQGQVFLLASMKCGIDNEWLEKRSINFGQGVSRFQGRNMELPDLDEDAAALAEMFCPAQEAD